MKILALKLRDGSVTLTEAPGPLLTAGTVRVRTLYSAVSPGTEGGKVVAGKMSLLGKARARPDQVRQVVDMARQIGVKGTLQKVRAKLEGAQPLGYSLAGVVTEVGEGVTAIAVGDLVACAGGGYANHADEVVVPVNLTARVPDGVPADAAAMTTLGAIALQGVRLAAPSLGEHAVVVGLGLVGLLACQLLRSAGCRVLGCDIAEAACDLARRSGSADRVARLGTDPVEETIADFTRGHGADLVIIAAATASNEPVEMAGRVTRKRGRVVVTGAVGMDLPREDYYRKELSFAVSCSYGPGRYDPTYEEGGLDYPYGFVRWTEGRNLEAVLDLVAADKVRPRDLVTHRFPFAEAPAAYDLVAERREPYAGILLEYPDPPAAAPSRVDLAAPAALGEGVLGIGCIGAGSYAQSFLLPPLARQPNTQLTAIYTRTGLSAVDAGKRFGFARAVDSAEAVLDDPDTSAVVVATRHGEHGRLVVAALERGKHVFVEKPLCLDREELRAIATAARSGPPDAGAKVIQTGFNRRFSQAARRVKDHFGVEPGPLVMAYRVAAGIIPRDHWIQDPREGGGRILGEVCHFIDTMQFLCGGLPVAVHAVCVDATDPARIAEDDVSITLRFSDGSVGTVVYVAHGAKNLPKERLEVHGAGRSAILENFTAVSLHDERGSRRARCAGKGQEEEIAAFVAGIRTGQAPLPLDHQLATTLATLEALTSLRTGAAVRFRVEDLWTSTTD